MGGGLVSSCPQRCAAHSIPCEKTDVHVVHEHALGKAIGWRGGVGGCAWSYGGGGGGGAWGPTFVAVGGNGGVGSVAKRETFMFACSFCGQSESDVGKLIIGPEVSICRSCADMAAELSKPKEPG